MKFINKLITIAFALSATTLVCNADREFHYINWDNPPADVSFHRDATLKFFIDDKTEHTVTLIQGPEGFQFNNGLLSEDNPTYVVSGFPPGDYVFKDLKSDKQMKLRIKNLFEIRDEFKINNDHGGSFIPKEDEELVRKQAEDRPFKKEQTLQQQQEQEKQEQQTQQQQDTKQKQKQENKEQQQANTNNLANDVKSPNAKPKSDAKPKSASSDAKAKETDSTANAASAAAAAATQATPAAEAETKEGNGSNTLTASVTMIASLAALSIAYLL